HLFGAEPVAMPSSEPKIEVGRLVERVRNDLIDAEYRRIKEGRPPLFQVKSFDLEINFVVKTSQSADAKANFEVVTLGVGDQAENQTVQKIMLHMASLDDTSATVTHEAVQPTTRDASPPPPATTPDSPGGTK